MTETKLEINKLYNIKGNPYNPHKVLFIAPDNQVLTSDKDGDWDLLAIEDNTWEEYKEPDIFDGIEVGDIVEINNRMVAYFLSKSEKRAYFTNTKGSNPSIELPINKIKSITKLVMQNKKE